MGEVAVAQTDKERRKKANDRKIASGLISRRFFLNPYSINILAAAQEELQRNSIKKVTVDMTLDHILDIYAKNL